VHDTADLEERGIPAIFVATVEFSDAAVGQAKALGADPAGVFVHHPIQDRTDQEMREIADQAIAKILAKLVQEDEA
jgi:hypothetical protein